MSIRHTNGDPPQSVSDVAVRFERVLNVGVTFQRMTDQEKVREKARKAEMVALEEAAADVSYRAAPH